MRRFTPARLAIATAGVSLLLVRVAVELYRNYVNHHRWTLDYSHGWYAAAAATVAVIIFGRFPAGLASALLLVTGFLQTLVIVDSWQHVGRPAHGDDFGVVFIYIGEFYFLVALLVFTAVFHLLAAVERASRKRSAGPPHPQA